ncbi:helix-turn-helix transcriptional regulator [Vagococcus sp. BWB3-3]|uniref:Helix-turn-helix transcriptional regulator n=1 Tax=Vagococcus allomyrinae TaxID=2794353 RepID=A0A940P6I1_9ENTE|nr:AraC family transcriptional regulator [Vagococcus allomyrinae]MBP1040651.1 helix-turn-helix transcriptional regulator [Vagococcus allomyrinae]
MSNERYEINHSSHIRKLALNLLYVTKSKYEPDWHSTVHTHDFTEMFYVLKGKGNFIARNQRFPVKENDLVIVNPHIEHTEESVESSPMEYIVLGVEGLAFNLPQDQTDVEKDFTFFNYSDEKKEVLFYLNDLLEEIQTKRQDYEVVCQNLIENLVIRMLRYSQFELEEVSNQKLNKDIAFVKHYIDTHYQHELTLESLAEIAHINKFYLVHLFKDYMNATPIAYLVQKRIKESQTLLASTNYTISQISSIVGFSSQSHFSYTFKKINNLTPKEYREIKNKEKS